MRSCATLHAARGSGVVHDASPLVLIDGTHEPSLRVVRWSVEDALDRRSAVIEPCDPRTDRRTLARWERARVTLVIPLRLSDGSDRSLVLCTGRLVRGEATLAAGREEQTFTLTDEWSALLASPPRVLWRETESGIAVEERPKPSRGVLRTGSRGNRSIVRHTLHGMAVHVLRERGVPWRLLDAVETLAAFMGVEISTAGVTPDIAAAPLAGDINLSAPWGQMLAAVLEPYGLALRRELFITGGAITQRVRLITQQGGSLVRITPPRQGGDVLRVRCTAPVTRSRLWVAQAHAPRVEGTFTLLPGWSPHLEGLPDEAYTRTANPAFDDVANVYRLWSLNEDGRFTLPPFERGNPFDLAGFFGDESLRGLRASLRFETCLTLDDAGRGRSIVVEVSEDSGDTWARYPGDVLPRNDSAAVYLNDAQLPPGFFTAAKAGTARVRVTATLQSPAPLTASRWLGNPFAGTDPPRVISLDDTFALRRVHASSIHRAGIDAGLLTADEIDQRAAMRAWLARRVARERANPTNDGGGLIVELSGVWPTLRVGDRLAGVTGAGLDAGHPLTLLPARHARVRSVVVLWRGGGARPITRVELSGVNA